MTKNNLEIKDNFELELVNLNKEQFTAVTTINRPVRIIAGAGSGKTRVICYKISYLINVIGIEPSKILAVTFTNKAAREMKKRCENLIGKVAINSQISTYHALFAKILRKHIHLLGYPNFFNIIDTSDKRQLIREIYKELDYNYDAAEIRTINNEISLNKLSKTSVMDLMNDAINITQRQRAKVYERYLQICFQTKVLDFDDLIIFVEKLFLKFPEVVSYWRNQYDYFLIDEFQDTSSLQYNIIRYMITDPNSITVVGDPDQNIYSWRGASGNIILNFDKDFKNTKTIVLAQNYRSTKNILGLANNLISNNQQRIEKNLYTDNGDGNLVTVYEARSQATEATWIAKRINSLILLENFSPRDICILYRSNFSSSEIEKALIAKNINYQIFGGLKFFERKEIKDVISYIKLLIFEDNLAAKRILNLIPGVGEITIAEIENIAVKNNMSVANLLCHFQDKVRVKSREKIFFIFDFLREETNKLNENTSLTNLINNLVTITGYISNLKENFETERIDNVNELVRQISEFDSRVDSNLSVIEKLTLFLQEVTLYTSTDEIKNGNFVTLMTIHAAKGLEYKNIFITNLNDNIFPSKYSILSEFGVEEERRLFYVAITRAELNLFLSYNTGYSVFTKSSNQPSQFISELNKEFLIFPKSIKPSFLNSEKSFSLHKVNGYISNFGNNSPIHNYRINDTVYHDVFGKGTVLKLLSKDKLMIVFNKNNIIKILNSNSPQLKTTMK